MVEYLSITKQVFRDKFLAEMVGFLEIRSKIFGDTRADHFLKKCRRMFSMSIQSADWRELMTLEPYSKLLAYFRAVGATAFSIQELEHHKQVCLLFMNKN